MSVSPASTTTTAPTGLPRVLVAVPAEPEAGVGELATLPAARLDALTAAVRAAATLPAAWRDSGATRPPRGSWRPLQRLTNRARAEAFTAAADELRRALRPAVRAVSRPGAAPVEDPRPLRGLVVAAVGHVVAAHNALPSAGERAAHASRLPMEVAQAVLDVVAPAAHARALARARGLLLDAGHVEAAGLLSELEETP